jgi:hypothetical protein
LIVAALVPLAALPIDASAALALGAAVRAHRTDEVIE